MPALMIQGCGSDVGKSVLVAGLCRLLTNRGHRVRPFKPQNMSNNAAVTVDGGEIGRSTALQALACRTEPTTDMNPVLLKPQGEVGAQLIVQGRRVGTLDAKAHRRGKRHLLQAAVESYRRLERDCDWIVVEGAGSPAETNLRENDIANMGFAHAVDLPVVLVGDIERGHVIASLVGAHTVLDRADRERIRGFVINKFRGDVSLFGSGVGTIEAHTGWHSLGVVPWIAATRRLPAEDGMQLAEVANTRSRAIEATLATGATQGSRAAQPTRAAQALTAARAKIVVVHLPHIANFDDFDALRQEPEVDLILADPRAPLPLDAQLVILPGSKTTIADLDVLREHGWDHELHAYLKRGGRVLGICAGYQMLGHVVRDPHGIEGSKRSTPGLALLDIETTMDTRKSLRFVSGTETTQSARIEGYEMHIGRSAGPATARPMVRFEDGTVDGAVNDDGRIAGCHVHGIFNSTAYRAALLASLGARSAGADHLASVDAALDEVAAVLERTLKIDELLRLGSRPLAGRAP
jgi:adenosylcobyric acid synthase